MKLAFTVCSVSHLGQAKAMADSFVKFNPDYTFKIGIVDKIAGRVKTADFDPYELIEIEEFEIPNLLHLCQKYDGLEMCCLAKPFMASYLLRQYPEVKKILYLDTDMLFFGTMESVEKELESASILLTPHVLSPYADTHLYPLETSHLNAGLYNAGFWGIAVNDTSKSFLIWWQERLVNYGFVNFMDGMFVDQLWLNYVPLFFKNVRISDNLGLNVGYWNLHERKVQLIDNQYVVNDKFPLIFFHYSGYKTNLPEKISVHTDRYDLQNRSELRPLFSLYHDQLSLNKHKGFLKLPNLLISEKKYKKWGKLREYALRISRKLIRELHG